MHTSNDRGYTLIEILIVMAIIGVLLSIATSSMAEYIGQTKLRTTLMSLAGHVRHAGMTALGAPKPCTIKFDVVAGAYTFNDSQEVLLPPGVRFGADSGVTGTPGDSMTPPPKDGISFDSPGHANTLIYYPEGYVVPAGTIYITDGKRTMAVRVANTGRVKLWSYVGGNKWREM